VPGRAKEPASEEIRRLKKELSRVKLERDILKKAAACFASVKARLANWAEKHDIQLEFIQPGNPQ